MLFLRVRNLGDYSRQQLNNQKNLQSESIMVMQRKGLKTKIYITILFKIFYQSLNEVNKSTGKLLTL